MFDETGDSFGDFSGVDWGNDRSYYNGSGYGTDTYDTDYGSQLTNYQSHPAKAQQTAANDAYNASFSTGNTSGAWQDYINKERGFAGFLTDMFEGARDGYATFNNQPTPLKVVSTVTNPLYPVGGLMLSIAGALGGQHPGYEVADGGQPEGYYKDRVESDPIPKPIQTEDTAQKVTQNLGITQPGASLTDLFQQGDPYQAVADWLMSRGI